MGCFGDRFTIFEAIGEDAERENLDACDGVIPRGSVRHDTGQRGDLCNPAPVVFLFGFDFEVDVHVFSIASRIWEAYYRFRDVALRSLRARLV